jgi:ligand-binding sensor protein
LGSRFFWEKDQWPIWSAKFLAKAKHSGFKDVLLGKVNIPKSDEEVNKRLKKERILMKNSDLNEMAYTELILSIEVRRRSGKVMFVIIKGRKSRDYTDGNYALA